MRLPHVNPLVFGLISGAAFASTLTIIITVWEWLENPGGIFRGPDGTNWRFIRDTAVSWLFPTLCYAVPIAAVARVMIGAVARGWKARRRRLAEGREKL